ncbi:SMI1/KNR4 family protein [Amycolatopsis pithecellobii]|uniref:Knr4/Smi1-like domain-containing protein n=1 Tax=Amycolatopsis pithecellobii TaxID=664692 RepID=A0A6N7ZBN8_9PSEU|nr:SMI1/KNR4 family protein [Amycolatopsis pithecellobii]MTD59150.1 hypothetical protein [Amycolatopsis pithecellobii]
MGRISSAWAVIDAWLERHAPASAQARRGPATSAEIAAAEAELGFALPPDFAESVAVHDGQPDGCDDFPYRPLLPLAGIVATRRMLMEVAADGGWLGEDGDDAWWHEQWLPIGRLDGDVELLDCRPGPGYGRLGVRPNDDVAHFEPGWGLPDFAGYLDAIATALTEGDFDGMKPHLTPEGKLCWAFPDEDEDLTPVR